MPVSEARALPGARVLGGARGVWREATREPWRHRAVIAAAAAVYVCAWGLLGLLDINATDLDVFFLPSARIALAGHPLQVYSLRYMTLYPNANGPLSLVPLTAVAALAQRLGWLDDVYLRRMLVMAAFAVFALLMGREAMAAVDRLRGERVGGIWRALGYLLFLASPTLLHGTLLYGHIELSMTIWLMLLSVRMLAEERPGRAGLSLGLAILARSSAVLYLIPLVVLLAARKRWRAAAWLGGVAVATVGLGLLPFYLADPSDVVFSLVTFRGALPIGGGGIWQLAIGTPYEALGQYHDATFVLATALLLSVALVLARRDFSAGGREVYGLVALAAICFPLFIKTVWPYYFADLYVLVGVWWLGEAGRWWNEPRRWVGVILPGYAVACGLVAEYGVELGMSDPQRVPESVALVVLVVGFIVVFGTRLVLGEGRRERTRTPASVPELLPTPLVHTP